jgi:hypothetical protein
MECPWSSQKLASAAGARRLVSVNISPLSFQSHEVKSLSRPNLYVSCCVSPAAGPSNLVCLSHGNFFFSLSVRQTNMTLKWNCPCTIRVQPVQSFCCVAAKVKLITPTFLWSLGVRFWSHQYHYWCLLCTRRNHYCMRNMMEAYERQPWTHPHCQR